MTDARLREFKKITPEEQRILDRNSGMEQQFVIAVLEYIRENYQSGGLRELADILHCNVYWLSREIKNRTGKTYTELLQGKRLNQAAYLLHATGLPVIEVAFAVGYDNASYFRRIFLKQFHKTPRQYRLEHRS